METGNPYNPYGWVFSIVHNLNSEVWILDSGATCHIVNNRKFFDTFDGNVKYEICVANGEKVMSIGKKSGKIKAVDKHNKSSPRRPVKF